MVLMFYQGFQLVLVLIATEMIVLYFQGTTRNLFFNPIIWRILFYEQTKMYYV